MIFLKLSFQVKLGRVHREIVAQASSAAPLETKRGLNRIRLFRRLRKSFEKKRMRILAKFAKKERETTDFPEFFIGVSKQDRAETLLSLCKLAKAEIGPELPEAPAMSATQVRVGVVIYNNTDEQLSRLLRSIECSALPEHISLSVTFFNNGEDRPSPVAEKLSVSVQKSGKNIGFGAAHNIMMREAFADCDYYIGVNPDGFFEGEAIASLVRMSAQKQGRALIEAVQFPEEHPKVYHPKTFETNWISGACFIYPRQIWEELGGFDEHFFLYCEDVDLSWRARVLGIPTLTCPEALFYHDTIDRQGNSERYRQMLIAGRYLAYKWRSDRFLSFTENCLREVGGNGRQLPQLGYNCPRMPANLAPVNSFAERFHFAETRW